jgi:DNA repair protein RecO (recombination protein O)
VITLLTPDGVISAYARNSLRPKNKLTTPTAMLSYSDFELFAGKNMYTVDEAQLKHRFVRIFSDVRSYALAAYFCELLKLLAPIEDDAGDFMSLMLNSLYLLNEGGKEAALVKCVFEMRIACYAGYMPDLTGCKVCGQQAGGGYFDMVDGTYFCGDCAPRYALPANCSGSVLLALRHIIESDPAKAYAFALGEQSKESLYQLCERYIATKLEKNLATLDFYKTIAT